MTMARTQLVDSSVTRWYHCVTRVVRGASLLGEGESDRKQWIEDRLEELTRVFAISVGGFAVQDSRLHLLLRLDPDVAESWSDEEVVRRWGRLFPPQDRAREDAPVTKEWVQRQLKTKGFAATSRERLMSLGWFMKCLKEPLSRMANREEDVRGAFFEGRFKSVAILDDPSLLATCVCIDLNLGEAGAAAAPAPKASKNTSIKQRAAQAKARSRGNDKKAPPRGRSAGPEKTEWLCPIDDRRNRKSSREGMIPGVSLENYLLLVEYTSRLLRAGKAPVPEVVGAIFEQFEIDAEWWQARMLKLSQVRLTGRFSAATRERLQEVAESLGVRRVR
jgi:hypothetical protein